MKQIYTIVILLFTTVSLWSQTDGISYQAVIIDNNPQEIPGVDIPSNNLPNQDLIVRFTILGIGDTVEYQEEQETQTDAFGMINLMIGRGDVTLESPGDFVSIYWNNEKFLRVEIDLLDGNGFIPFSYQELTYIPYVKHREIIATSTLDVDGATNLNNSFSVNNESPSNLSGTLNVDGNTNLNASFFVNNQSPSLLSGDLTVEGNTYLNGDLTVLGEATFNDGVFQNLVVEQTTNVNTLTADGVTNINNAFNVNNENLTYLSGNLNVNGVTSLNNDLDVVGGQTTLSDSLTVFGRSTLYNKVRIAHDPGIDDEGNIEAYPLQIIGGQQGMSIKLSPNTPNENNNYITFWDGDDDIRGRIEAKNNLITVGTDIIYDIIDIPGLDDIIDADENDEPANVAPNQFFYSTYAFGAYQLTLELVVSAIRFGINATAAAGACVTGDCDDAVWSFIDMTAAGIQLGGYITYNEINMGVAFESGGADYAEWLKKLNMAEQLTYGDIVGVQGGVISKSFIDAGQFMVISRNPMVSGAMPDKGQEDQYEKVAFLGQVPVKVLGEAKVGDYIVASGNGDGYGIAIDPTKMKINDYKRIVGVAWSDTNASQIFSYVQTAIGINTNDLTNQVEQMQTLMNVMQRSLSKLDPNFKAQYFDVETKAETNSQHTKASTLKEHIADNSEALQYDNLGEALRKVTETMRSQSKFDIYRMPYIKAMVENPTKENAEKIVSYYTKVLAYLEKIQPKKH